MGVITLTGNNLFRIDQLVNAKVLEFTDQFGAMAVERIDAGEAEASEVLSRVGAESLFASHKLTILKGLADNRELAESVEKLISSVGAGHELVIVLPKPDKRSKTYALLKKISKMVESTGQSGSDLVNWARDFTKEQGGTIERDAAVYLIERVGNDQVVLASELNKLITYDPHVSCQTINLLVEPSPQSKVFDLLRAAFAGNKRTVEKIYAEQRALKVEPLSIIGLIVWQLQMLAVIKAARSKTNDEIANDLGSKITAVASSANLSRRISDDRLNSLITGLLELDDKLKQQAINADDALLYFLLTI